MLKLDYSLETPEERNKLVADIIEGMDEDDLNPGYLEVLADYLILCMEKQEKKEKKILTENRMATVNREKFLMKVSSPSLKMVKMAYII